MPFRAHSGTMDIEDLAVAHAAFAEVCEQMHPACDDARGRDAIAYEVMSRLKPGDRDIASLVEAIVTKLRG